MVISWNGEHWVFSWIGLHFFALGAFIFMLATHFNIERVLHNDNFLLQRSLSFNLCSCFSERNRHFKETTRVSLLKFDILMYVIYSYIRVKHLSYIISFDCILTRYKDDSGPGNTLRGTKIIRDNPKIDPDNTKFLPGRSNRGPGRKFPLFST